MKRIICWLLGHQWGDWYPLGAYDRYNRKLSTFDDVRQCRRCRKMQIAPFRRKIAVGSTVQIKMPQRWAVTDALDKKTS